MFIELYKNLQKHPKWPTFIQFIKFGIVGLFNTLLTLAIQNGAYYLLGWHEQVSNAAAFVITVYISFILNGQLVFKKQEEENRHFWKALLKVYISYSFTGLFLMSLLLYIQETLLGIPNYIATIIPIPITVPINFLLNKYWAYRKKK